MRLDGWEERFIDELNRHAALPGEYGISDCFMMAMDVASVITDKLLDYDFDYSNEIGAALVMRDHNWTHVGHAFASYFPQIPPSMAWRGDIGVVEWDEELCGVVVLGLEVVGKHPVKGIVRVPRSALKLAYRVD
jgi:hypothetical protein